MSKRKYEAIDLMKLRAKGSTNGWNEELKKLFDRRDINGLAKLKYRICAGMVDLANHKLNDAEMDEWFCRLVRSIEITAKRIIKLKHPLPGDNPLIAQQFVNENEVKKKRDQELMAFLRDSSY